MFIVLLTIWSCATAVPLDRHFYSRKKVGVIIQVDSIRMTKQGSQGLLDIALTPGNRFRETLKAVEPQMQVEERLGNEMTKILNSKSKEFVFIDTEFDYEKLGKFIRPKSPREYSKKDYRPLKAKYNVDELIYIQANYGLQVSYSGLIEVGKDGYMRIYSEIVNLEDNMLLHDEFINQSVDIKGNWKEGEEFSNLKTAINAAVDKAIIALRTQYYAK